ncbi:ciliogenesis and planar polarity effector 1-like isoform X2 [Gorilla gorilla gorilla]|uniref:ciliogenesis and planar polarity effector 1-like isoform X2 n=1 Tax=Gorilla gorilla gorilla TaxID=9595 RepID=UPI00300ABF6C
MERSGPSEVPGSDASGPDPRLAVTMGFTGFGKKARTFDLEAMFEQTRRTAVERSRKTLAREKEEEMNREKELRRQNEDIEPTSSRSNVVRDCSKSSSRNAPNHMELTSIRKPTDKKKMCNQKENPTKKEDHEKLSQNTLPVIGVWEFERDDDEYIKFLDLFLSYILERDLPYSRDAGIPFLTSFSGKLREHELNSLLFDVHTTLK